MVDVIVFALAALACLGGALGVILGKNPVHAALCLVGTFFGLAVLYVAQEAHFLAATQVIVYAGAIVVLILFVIMLLGVDNAAELETESLAGQRPMAAVAGVGTLGMALAALYLTRDKFDEVVFGARIEGRKPSGIADAGPLNVPALGRSLFTDYLFAFEIVSVLLVIAVVGAVVLSRRPADDSKNKN